MVKYLKDLVVAACYLFLLTIFYLICLVVVSLALPFVVIGLAFGLGVWLVENEQKKDIQS